MTLRFSLPSEFNDRFDSYHRLPLTADPKVKGGRARLRSALGVLCLAESPDNHMMWVTYAKNHTGFVVAFDASSEFFSADGRILRKVVYQPRPPVFQGANDNGCFYKALRSSAKTKFRTNPAKVSKSPGRGRNSIAPSVVMMRSTRPIIVSGEHPAASSNTVPAQVRARMRSQWTSFE
jgi:hypothetical protein